MKKRNNVPIAVRMRASAQMENKNKNTVQPSIQSIEEQIAALEASPSSDSESGSDCCSGDDEGLGEVETDGEGRVLRIVSTLAKERITPLPKSMLPAAQCGKQKIAPGRAAPADTSAPARKRLIRFADEGPTSRAADHKKKQPRLPPPPSSSSSSPSSARKPSGMEATIREMLRGYEPSSSERKPFWCRICQFQGSCEQDFFEHRASEFHKLASKMEAKMSYCSLCRKQFTSPAQLKEHLDAKTHKDRLARVQESQGRAKNFC
jgi:hypothetical protein